MLDLHKRLALTALLAPIASLAPLVLVDEARAAGFQLNDHGTASMARANATIATIKDPSAIYYNPAGLTGTEGTQFYVGATLISPHAAYEGVGIPALNPTGAIVREDASRSFVPVPHAYLSQELSSKIYVGFGFYLPYGLGNEWENPNFVGRTTTEKTELRTFFLAPAAALKLSDAISIGASVSLVPATVYIRRTLGARNGDVLFSREDYGTEGKVELAGSAFGVGANLGVQLTLMEKLKIGAGYRSAVNLKFDGNVNFRVPDGAPSQIAANFPDGPINAEVTLPHAFNLAVGFVDGPLTLEAGVQLTLWGSFDELRINFERMLPQRATASPRNWKLSPLFKAGGEYRIADLTLRAGGAFDVSPAPDETVEVGLPDRDRVVFALGGGYSFGPAFIDVAYTGVITLSRESKESISFVPGKYPGGFIHLIGASVGLKL